MKLKLFALLIFLLVISCSTLKQHTGKELAKSVNGKIVTPTQDTKVQREFDFEVEIANPNPQKYYYLVNEVSGNYWPKSRIFISGAGGSYSGQSNEGGTPPNGIFYIVLFEVFKNEHHKIQNWWKSCNETGDWPGIQINGNLLDRVKVKLK